MVNKDVDKMLLLQLAQTALVQNRQLAADLVNVRRQLNASDTDISDVTAAVDKFMTSAQAVQNFTMTTPDAIDLRDATVRLTQLETDATNLDNQVHTRRSVSSAAAAT